MPRSAASPSTLSPIISIPCMVVSAYAFWILIKGIRERAGLSLDEILTQAPKGQSPAK